MPLLDKAAIFDIAEQGFKMTAVAVPEWGVGVEVRVRELSAEEFQRVGLDMSGAEGQAQVSRALDYTYDVVVWCVVDDKGQRVFEDGDKKALREKGKRASFYAGLARIANAVYDLSGLTSDEEEEDESPN
jgi:hypothetical protein